MTNSDEKPGPSRCVAEGNCGEPQQCVDLEKKEVITDPCKDCRGAGRQRDTRTLSVMIPAGVDDGSRMRLSGEGDAGVCDLVANDGPVFEAFGHRLALSQRERDFQTERLQRIDGVRRESAAGEEH